MSNATPLSCTSAANIWSNLPSVYQKKVQEIANELSSGTPFQLLGGKKIRCNKSLVRFRVGRNHRLILKTGAGGRELQLLNRQCYEKAFERRC
ncbi:MULTISPECIES: hypothetical protein [unclassified Endozoicomonas]|uniref:ParE family toxin-like protein n=1 Tax=unclassified Endozoicomonas TaxID=2644528 RepID=UPI003BB7CFEE